MLASRLPLATGSGLFLSLATFWLLWLTVNTPLVVVQSVILKPPEFTRKIADRPPVDTPDRERPELIIRETVGPPGPIQVPTTRVENPKPGPGNRIKVGTPPGPVTHAGGMDGDPIPLVRIEPTYPRAAETHGIEGWVIVQFSVTATGQVTDVFVVDADPPGKFEKATVDAVRRWRYQPKVEDGTAVERVGLRTLIRFEL